MSLFIRILAGLLSVKFWLYRNRENVFWSAVLFGMILGAGVLIGHHLEEVAVALGLALLILGLLLCSLCILLEGYKHGRDG